MRIALPRGDIKFVRFLINDMNGTITDVDFSEIYFTVKKTTDDIPFLFQKKLSAGTIQKIANGDYQLKIEPEDTYNLSYGRYKFDVNIKYLNQIDETFVGDFVITEEVTFKENE